MILRFDLSMYNAAFEDSGSGNEAARILRGLAARVEGCELASGESFALVDVNGNKVGEAKILEL